eukprot:15268318-Heterocapsa_arctica.AAC.1
MENDKQRFQLAVHTVDGLNANDRRIVTRIYAIRCTSGHSIVTMKEYLNTPLTVSMKDNISAITHCTKSANIGNIIRYGLCPGGGVDNSRAASNFNAFLPDDLRNVVEGRQGAAYDAVI